MIDKDKTASELLAEAAERAFAQYLSTQALAGLKRICDELGIPTNQPPRQGLSSVVDECVDAIRALKAKAKP